MMCGFQMGSLFVGGGRKGMGRIGGWLKWKKQEEDFIVYLLRVRRDSFWGWGG